MKSYNYAKKDYEIWQAGFYGLCQGFRRLIRNVALSNWMNTFLILCVLGNTIVLTMDGLVDQEGEFILSQCNLAFTYIFTIDMGMKIIGMGIVEYLKDSMNIFDSVIVSLSIVELFIFGTGGGSSISAFRSVRIFRTFRVLRVSRLVRSLQYMKVIM